MSRVSSWFTDTILGNILIHYITNLLNRIEWIFQKEVATLLFLHDLNFKSPLLSVIEVAYLFLFFPYSILLDPFVFFTDSTTNDKV